jgi:hypothetical protein
MPRYYFHLCNAGGHFIEDEVGVELQILKPLIGKLL